MVAECNGHCVSIISQCGNKIRSFGTRGSDVGQFTLPCGVAVDGKGNILVADSRNHRIQKLTSEGKFLIKSVGTRGNGRLQFYLPQGIAYNCTKIRCMWWITIIVLQSLTLSSAFLVQLAVATDSLISPRI